MIYYKSYSNFLCFLVHILRWHDIHVSSFLLIFVFQIIKTQKKILVFIVFTLVVDGFSCFVSLSQKFILKQIIFYVLPFRLFFVFVIFNILRTFSVLCFVFFPPFIFISKFSWVNFFLFLHKNLMLLLLLALLCCQRVEETKIFKIEY